MSLIPQTAWMPNQPPAVPPVYFRSLTIERFKCFAEPVKLDFTLPNGRPSRWTVILGENGVGKTTVLQALAGLCGRVDKTEEKKGVAPEKFMVGAAMSDPSWFPWHKNGEKDGSREGHAFSASIQIGALFEESRSVETLDWFVKFKESPPNIITMSGTALSPSKMGGLLCYAYGASRLMAPSGRARTQRPDRDRIESLMSENVALPNAEEWLLEIDHAAKITGADRGSFYRRFETIKGVLLKVLPDIEDIRVAVAESTTSQSPVRVEFRTKHGWVTISNLSLGYKSMIAWIVDLTRRLFERYPTSQNPIQEPAIVLVDELDLHLHPQWQRTVIDFLTERFTNTQFIVTAHSPLVLHSASPAKVILMEHVNGVVRANHELDAIKTWRIDQILTSDLFKLNSAHPPEIANAISQRSKILQQPKLSVADELEVSRLNHIIHSVPSGDSDIERRAEQLIKEAMELQARRQQ